MPRKMRKSNAPPSEGPPAKRAKFLSDDEDDQDQGVSLTINKEFAARFEHNKKREEKQKLEEKYKNGEEDEESDSSTSEEEDDDADLVTADLDAEIFATLDAIKKRDPRVYDKSSTFYTPFDPETADENATATKEKPMYLSDYHRKNLLEGNVDLDDDEDAPPRTYAQEQEDLKASLVTQMHTAAAEDDDDDGFLVKKDKGTHADMQTSDATQSRRAKITQVDIETADRDPETFLSNFMASRAWRPDEKTSRFDAFDSDDSEDLDRAEEFEAAYNMRFEDPKTSNEKLMTFSRDVAKYSVRRDDLSGRKKQREKERERKDAAKRQRDEEKARLRKLKIDEVEEKVKKIKEAAGLRGQQLDLKEWKQVLEEDWDDDRWESEMTKRFGDNYYEDEDQLSDDEQDADRGDKHKKPKKPTWDDDIDVADIAPDLEAEKPTVALTDDEADAEADAMDVDQDEDEDADAEQAGSTKRKTKKDRLRERADAKRVARKERMAIEELVDHDLSTALPLPSHGRSKAGAAAGEGAEPTTGFRYRETSPNAFGLTARDILFADDAQLNQFAGLKKMAAFRDAEKKRKDKKKLGKKARLRQWRKETFGDEEGFTGGFKEFLSKAEEAEAEDGAGAKKRKSRKRKAGSME